MQTRKRKPASGFRGVYFNKHGRSGFYWVSQITVPGQGQKLVGHFKDPLVAALAYDQAALKHHGDNALLNFPELA
jgi:hypothetical protein